MSDPKYNKYAGTVRFDDDNIVDIDLQPDTENIRVLLNGSEVTGGAELPEVDSGDNGKVLTVVSGEWAAATPATPPAELPAVTSDDNGDVLTVVAGAWAKAAPTSDIFMIPVEVTEGDGGSYTATTTAAGQDIIAALNSSKLLYVSVTDTAAPELTSYLPLRTLTMVEDPPNEDYPDMTFMSLQASATKVDEERVEVMVNPSTYACIITYTYTSFTFAQS